MQFSVKTGEPQKRKTSCLVVPIFSNRELSPAAAALDENSEGQISQILKRGDIEGDEGQLLLLYSLPGIAAERVMLLGCGKSQEFSAGNWRKAVSSAVTSLNQSHSTEAVFSLLGITLKESSTYQLVRDLVTAAEGAVYRFDLLKSDPKKPHRPLKRITLYVADRGELRAAEKAITHGDAIASGTNLAKDLANLPGNLCTPTYLAERAQSLSKDPGGIQVKVLEEKDMRKLGMGALLSVSRGSRQPAKLIVMEYRGGSKTEQSVVLVGKGLTFDAGGISIKPAAAMDEMKYDMCGGASVIGTLSACAQLGLPLNVVGVVPASENLPDGDANKPGDIVTSMSGQTVEILNTDAEGRLILCDALTYSERFEPGVVIDVATLTGACVIALGKHAAGLMSNDETLAAELLQAGTRSGDRAWQLPLWEDYQSQLDSNFADMANIGGREAGALTAACFLSRFTKKFKWAHLDIAGVAWLGGEEKGATGRPVPMLSQYLLQRCKLAD